MDLRAYSQTTTTWNAGTSASIGLGTVLPAINLMASTAVTAAGNAVAQTVAAGGLGESVTGNGATPTGQDGGFDLLKPCSRSAWEMSPVLLPIEMSTPPWRMRARILTCALFAQPGGVLSSPTFTGAASFTACTSVTAPTPAPGDNSTKPEVTRILLKLGAAPISVSRA